MSISNSTSKASTGTDTIRTRGEKQTHAPIVSTPVLALPVELRIDINFRFHFLLLLNAMCDRLRNL